MEENFKVIDNYLMVKMPEEVDHHKSVFISRAADEYIMKEGVGNVVFDFEDTLYGQLRNWNYYREVQKDILFRGKSICH